MNFKLKGVLLLLGWWRWPSWQQDLSKDAWFRIIQVHTLKHRQARFHKTVLDWMPKKTQPKINYSDQSQQTQTVQWTNQNSKQMHVTVAATKRGKIYASQSDWFWFCFWLVEKVARDFLANQQSVAMQNQSNQEIAWHSIENRSKPKHYFTKLLSCTATILKSLKRKQHNTKLNTICF